MKVTVKEIHCNETNYYFKKVIEVAMDYKNVIEQQVQDYEAILLAIQILAKVFIRDLEPAYLVKDAYAVSSGLHDVMEVIVVEAL